MMQNVVRISSSVQMDNVSQTVGYVMETMTVETWLMNEIVLLLPHHHHQVYCSLAATEYPEYPESVHASLCEDLEAVAAERG